MNECTWAQYSDLLGYFPNFSHRGTLVKKKGLLLAEASVVHVIMLILLLCG